MWCGSLLVPEQTRTCLVDRDTHCGFLQLASWVWNLNRIAVINHSIQRYLISVRNVVLLLGGAG